MSPESQWSWTSTDIQNPEDGAAIRLHECGSGEVLLLVHGWTLDYSSFDSQLPLAEHYRLVTYDRRGFGESAAAPNLGAEPGDIDTIIDSLGVERVHLLGVSQGARIALRYAAAKPERLLSLILQGAVVDGYTAPVEDEGAIPLGHYAELVAQGKLSQMQDEWLAHPLMSSDTLDDRQRAALEHSVRGYGGQDLLSAPSGPAPPAILKQLANMATPTLIITGERETDARKAHAQQLRLSMPNAREMTLPRCGHLSNLSRADAYNTITKRFLGSL
ncbi:3-oxoadipate enol-lactone hydrolase [gamma proteobacterium NOR5-3]|nr:3-oxoadipate enol-lactone hydrolase [gamma proteobacterium NOR5-3]